MKKPSLDDSRLFSFRVGVALGASNVVGNGVLMVLGGTDIRLGGLVMLAASLLAYLTMNHEMRFRVKQARLVARCDKSKAELEIAERMAAEMRKAAGIGIAVQLEPQRGPTH